MGQNFLPVEVEIRSYEALKVRNSGVAASEFEYMIDVGVIIKTIYGELCSTSLLKSATWQPGNPEVLCRQHQSTGIPTFKERT